jgi:hypothetical protein
VAVYITPAGATVRDLTGLNGAMFGLSDAELDVRLKRALTLAEDDVFGRVGQNYRTATLDAYKVRHLQRAVAHRAFALWFDQIITQRATGTHPPLLIDDPETLTALLVRHEEMGDTQESLVIGGSPETRPGRYARPAVSASTFTVVPGDRTPSERLDLITETDDISVFDLNAG